MAKKNQEFYNALLSDELRDADATQRKKALDALLQADSDENFRKAIIANRVFWEAVDDQTIPEEGWDDVNIPANDAYIEHDDALYSIESLRQVVAQQRAKYSVSAITDQSVLLQILRHNKDQCRQYLATKIPELASAPGWQADPKSVLTNDAIDVVKRQAAIQYLTKVINDTKVENLQKLRDVITHENNTNALKTDLEALGIPPHTDALFNDLAATGLKDLIEGKIESLEKEASLKQFKEELQKFEDTLKDPDVLLSTAMRDLLHNDKPNFLDGLVALPPPVQLAPQAPPLNYQDKAKAQDAAKDITEEMHVRLCARYVEESLKRMAPLNIGHMVGVLKETRHGTIHDSLRDNFGFDRAEILDRAVVNNPAQNNKFKAALIKSYVKQLPAELANETLLQKLATPETSIQDIRSELSTKIGNGVSRAHLECLQAEDMTEIKRAARIQLFKLRVEQISRLGQGAHSKLIDLYSNLPDAKQVDLLKNLPHVNFVMSTQDDNVLKSYLGSKDAEGLDLDFAALKAENANIQILKQIQNPVIAKVLAGVTTNIHRPDQIDAINRSLLSKKDVADFTTAPRDFEVVLNVIFTQSGIADTGTNKRDFFAKFGYDLNAHTFTGPIATAIKDQHVRNKPLLDVLDPIKDNAARMDTRNFLGLMLRVEKAGPFDTDFDDLEEAFYESPDLETFLQKGQTLDAVNFTPAIQDKIRQDITSDEFNRLRKDYKDRLANSDNPADNPKIQAQHKEARDVLTDINAKSLALWDRREKLKVVANIDSPNFKGKTSNELAALKNTYKSAQEECLNAISYLEQAQKTLNALKPIEPVALTNPPRSDQQVAARAQVILEAKQLISDINVRLGRINSRLAQYKEIYNKISNDILPAINKASDNSEREIYTDKKATIFIQKRDKALQMSIPSSGGVSELYKPSVAAPRTAVSGGGPDRTLFQAVGKPEADEVICFDHSATVNVGRSTVNIHSRFTYDPSPPGGNVGTIKGSDVTKSAPGRYEVVEFPMPPQGQQPTTEIVKEQVDFSMRMAVQILANLKKPPTEANPLVIEGVYGKEEELKFLWTALVHLGEQNPKMKFSHKAIAITGDATFEPEKERDKRALIGTDKGWAKGSVHATVFEHSNYKNAVKDHVKNLQTRLDNKEKDAKKTKEVDTSIQKTMKDDMSGLRNELKVKAEDLKKKEGVTPEVARLQVK